MEPLPNLTANLTGGAGGAAYGGTVGPTTFGAVNVSTGISKTTLAIGAAVVLVIGFIWYSSRKKKS